jgi:hypothetical protein
MNIASPLKAIMSDAKSFGNIAAKTTPSSVQLTVGREAREQSSVPRKTSFEHIKPKLLKTLKMPTKTNRFITDCQNLPDGQMLFLDRNNKCLMLYSKDGVYSRDVVKFTASPCGVCYVKDNMIAVTFDYGEQVSFIDLTTNQIVKSVMVSKCCYGIESNGEIIVPIILHVACSAFCTMDLEGNILCPAKTMSERAVCISLFAKHIYNADYKQGILSCYRMNGDLLWPSNQGNIHDIRGLSIDRHGFAYAACSASDQVIVISQDGKQSRVILSQDDLLQYI